MSKSDNKVLVLKSKKIFNQLGIEVKTSQLYEFFSKLNNEKNWNIAKSKNLTFANALNFTAPNFIPTGILDLDNDLGGGLPKGTLNIIRGYMGDMFATSLGANALRQGLKVLHVPLLSSERHVEEQYASNLSGILRRLYVEQRRLNKSSMEHLKELKPYESILKIIKNHEIKITVESLQKHCREYFNAFKFDMIVVDYTFNLRGEKVDNERTRERNVYVLQILKSMAEEFNCVLVANSLIGGEACEGANVIKLSNFSDIEPGANRNLHVSLEGQLSNGKVYGVVTEPDAYRMITNSFFDPNKQK